METKPTQSTTSEEMLENQKKMIDYTMKQSFRYSMKTFFIMFPLMLVVLFGIIFLVYKVVISMFLK